MDFGLTEIQEITRKTVRDFAEQEVIPQSRAFDESQEFPHAWAKKMGELGLFGVFVPEKYGGSGPRYPLLCDHDRGPLGRGCKRRRHRAGVQGPFFQTAPPLRERGAKPGVPRPVRWG